MAPGLTGDIDHPCILLTDDFSEPEQVIVNLTVYENSRETRVDIPAGTKLAPNYTTNKRSTIHYAYSQRVRTDALDDLLGDVRSKIFGSCGSGWLEHIRLQLFESEDTPPRVLTFCEDLDWGY